VTDVFDGLKAARRATARFVQSAVDRGFEPKEESITDYLLSQLPPDLDVRIFTRAEENSTYGADWLWWWTDGHEWFGSLIQAKRRLPGRRPYDFHYTPRRSGRNPDPEPQIDTLLRAASRHGVPAVYALYNGDSLPEPVRDRCACTHQGEATRTRLSTAVVPALVAQLANPRGIDVSESWAPLECLACPHSDVGGTPLVLCALSSEMKAFLRADANLPRAVARRQLTQLAWARIGQFRAFSAWQPPRLRNDRVVTETGDDRGHFSEPWIEHVMRGLRSEPPEYIWQLMEDELASAPAELDRLAGVVIVSSVQNETGS
jgi:hypothetical protein